MRRNLNRIATATVLATLMSVLMYAHACAAPLAITATVSHAVLNNTLQLNAQIPGTDISMLSGGQFPQNNQRKIWWNAGKERWDAILPTSSPPASTASAWWIWHDIGGSPQPKIQAETGTARTPDVYWDESELTLYVFFSRGDSGTSKFRRYVFDPTADRYREDSVPGGVNAPTSLRGGRRVTIVKSPNGYLWAGINNGTDILVSRSINRGDSWAQPVSIKPTELKGAGEWVTFQADGKTRVGFAVTEDGRAPNAKVHFLHVDQDDSNWSSRSAWTDETSLLPGSEGDEIPDDELSAVSFEGRVFVVIETEPIGDSRKSVRPQLVVYERTTTDSWLKHVIRRYTGTGFEDAKHPVVTIEGSARLLVVTTGSSRQTHADLWYAPIDRLAERNEQWTNLTVFEVENLATERIYSTQLAQPRSPYGSSSNLLVLIDDRGEGKRMWRQVVSWVDRTITTTTATTTATTSTPTSSDPPITTTPATPRRSWCSLVPFGVVPGDAITTVSRLVGMEPRDLLAHNRNRERDIEFGG